MSTPQEWKTADHATSPASPIEPTAARDLAAGNDNSNSDDNNINNDASSQSSTSSMSPGVKRIELLNSQLGLYARISMFFGIWLIAYVYGLDGGVRNTYQ
ncbi:hypothetical protein BJX70DRAFT_396922, partial [Aspergillus crustosus]